MGTKIKLHGFNNLTKTLSFNFYDVSYTKDEKDRVDYVNYIDSNYSSERLTNILCNVTKQIGAHVLNISKQDYEPQGASVNLLITETPIDPKIIDKTCNFGKIGETKTIHAHLDKSHITVHTYPEYSPRKAISTFRIDIDVSTCGTISPLKSLNYLLEEFNSDIITDVVTIDYKVRGFTRTVRNKKIFNDKKIRTITSVISKKYLNKYLFKNLNLLNENTWLTKMVVKKLNVQDYLFNLDAKKLSDKKYNEILKDIKDEITDIYNGNNSKIKEKIKWN